LAYCAARKGQGGDWDEIDVAARRSEDGGITWSEMSIIANNGELPTDKPMGIADYVTNELHYLFQSNYEKLYYMKSTDDGISFSEPVEITATVEKFKAVYPWVVMAPGPGHGILLKSGRLVVPFWLSDGGAKEFGPNHRGHRPSIVVSVYSDDHGATWHPGEVVASNSETIAVPNETSCVQLADGRVMFNIRNESPNYRRLVSYSKDGATDWTPPEYMDAFFEPICFGSMIRVSQKPQQSKNRILFVNPDSRMNPWSTGKSHFEYSAPNRRRENLTLRMSYDEGQTWPVKKVLEPGISGYSDLTVLPDGSILCLYEKGGMGDNHFKTAVLTLAKFNLEWLTEGADHRDKRDQPVQAVYPEK
jgi:sialidase-1